jgi:uncharacterized protein (TIGR02118 family)
VAKPPGDSAGAPDQCRETRSNALVERWSGMPDIRPRSTPIHSATRKNKMIKVSFLYPYREDARFDIDYYCSHHMPWVAGLLGAALKGWSADAGIGGGAPDSKPAYAGVGHLLFDSVDDFKAAVAPHAKAFADDLPNYTDGDPAVVLISEIRATS